MVPCFQSNLHVVIVNQYLYCRIGENVTNEIFVLKSFNRVTALFDSIPITIFYFQFIIIES